MDKLAETLFVRVLRDHLQDSVESMPGYVTALIDRQIGKALHTIHQHPETRWSVEALAEIAGHSRSTFSERFNQLTGMGPGAVWRVARTDGCRGNTSATTAA